MSTMKTSDRGIELIKSFEGCSLEAYKCPAGKLTVGYGHTGPDVFEGQAINPEQAEGLLRQDLVGAERAVIGCVKQPLSQDQFDALVSFVFNVGAQAFRQSTLLKYLNDGDPARAAAEFVRWVHAGGVVLQGLVARRTAERKLFLSLM